MSKNISPKTIELSEPVGDERVPEGTITYFETRNRFQAFNILQREFERSKITQATLARRLGKGTDQVSRVLGSPGNITMDTFSEYLFAINGSQPAYDVQFPLRGTVVNDRGPDWLWLDKNESPKISKVSVESGSGKTWSKSQLEPAE